MIGISVGAAYIGLATIVGFIWWFVYSDSGPRIPYSELLFNNETAYPCGRFSDRHPSTVSMTVLVAVEMFNALNNLSENQPSCDTVKLIRVDSCAVPFISSEQSDLQTIHTWMVEFFMRMSMNKDIATFDVCF
ncbi:hypothetical protein ACH5RR_034949 [Cinchona calisaya]|uniref:Uncharacterized protein n=1 Tax=Cinchona calisaya TaxID=153742 RepID=A0ABD2YCE1_9GENT